jgi:hypothetical protein
MSLKITVKDQWIWNFKEVLNQEGIKKSLKSENYN